MGNNDIKGYSLYELFGKQSDQSNDSYLIPIYQRNYAWGLSEIKQLIDDVADYAKKEASKYYIGTLMVHQRADGKYEVIDGQQRLTTLFLMLCYSQKFLSNFSLDAQKLIFENRPKSTEALQRIIEYTDRSNITQTLKLNSDENNQAIIDGFNMMREIITDQGLSQTGSELTVEEFFNYLLQNVVIYRVILPKNTDLNHYFEVMNSRGEQLEKHEIIKARLLAEMEKLGEESDLTILASIWDAVANMNQYVQYGFSTDLRSAIFGKHWNDFKPADYHELKMIIREKEQAPSIDSENETNTDVNLADILANPTKYLPKENKNGSEDTTEPLERFYSVIQFPAFLLHVLKIFSFQKGIQNIEEKAVEVPLDDKQLIRVFEECFFKTNLQENECLENIREFTYLLLRMKFLFDHYVIKREYKENSEQWSLQALYDSAEKNSSGFYRQTFHENFDNLSINKQILMLQSAFHVSMPTQNYKYWLLGTLNILINTCQHQTVSLVVDAQAYLKRLEDQAERFMFDRYLAKQMQTYEAIIFSDDKHLTPIRSGEPLESTSITNLLTYGKIRNNFVFNYLDYRLWCSVVREGKLDPNEDKEIYEKFVFTFRSSVEHFYPQNPTDFVNKKQADEFPLHAFGNLCLLSASKNSQVSNDLPNYKHKYFETALKMKKIDSLKLYKMIRKLKENDDWLKGDSKAHEREMLEILFSPLKK